MAVEFGPKRKVIPPSNLGQNFVAQRRVAEAAGRAAEKTRIALTVDSFPSRLWLRNQRGSVQCPCSSEQLGPANNPLTPTRAPVIELSVGEGANLHEVDKAYPLEGQKPQPGLNLPVEPPEGYKSEWVDEIGRLLLGDGRRCGLCWGTGWLDGHTLWGGQRYLCCAVSTPWVEVDSSSDVDIDLESPTPTMVGPGIVAWHLDTVPQINLLDAFRVREGLHAAKSGWLLTIINKQYPQGVDATTALNLDTVADTVLDEDQLPTTLILTLPEGVRVSHIEMVLRSEPLVNVQLPNLQLTASTELVQPFVQEEFEVDPVIGWLERGSIIEAQGIGGRLGSVWIVTDVNEMRTAQGVVWNITGNVRNVQPNETLACIALEDDLLTGLIDPGLVSRGFEPTGASVSAGPANKADESPEAVKRGIQPVAGSSPYSNPKIALQTEGLDEGSGYSDAGYGQKPIPDTRPINRDIGKGVLASTEAADSIAVKGILIASGSIIAREAGDSVRIKAVKVPSLAQLNVLNVQEDIDTSIFAGEVIAGPACVEPLAGAFDTISSGNAIIFAGQKASLSDDKWVLDEDAATVYQLDPGRDLWNGDIMGYGPPQAFAASDDGRYIAYVTYNKGILISSDSGKTWTPKIVGSGLIKTLAMSGDGLYILAGDIGGISIIDGVTYTGNHALWYSNNYGNTFDIVDQEAEYHIPVISRNGKVFYDAYPGGIKKSVDRITWTSITPVTPAGVAIWSALACSANGNYVVACDGGVEDNWDCRLSGLQATKNRIFISSNRGVNWQWFPIPEPFCSVAISDDGKTIVAGGGYTPKAASTEHYANPSYVWLSLDYGNSWIRQSELKDNSWLVGIAPDGRYYTVAPSLFAGPKILSYSVTYGDVPAKYDAGENSDWSSNDAAPFCSPSPSRPDPALLISLNSIDGRPYRFLFLEERGYIYTSNGGAVWTSDAAPSTGGKWRGKFAVNDADYSTFYTLQRAVPASFGVTKFNSIRGGVAAAPVNYDNAMVSWHNAAIYPFAEGDLTTGDLIATSFDLAVASGGKVLIPYNVGEFKDPRPQNYYPRLSWTAGYAWESLTALPNHCFWDAACTNRNSEIMYMLPHKSKPYLNLNQEGNLWQEVVDPLYDSTRIQTGNGPISMECDVSGNVVMIIGNLAKAYLSENGLVSSRLIDFFAKAGGSSTWNRAFSPKFSMTPDGRSIIVAASFVPKSGWRIKGKVWITDDLITWREIHPPTLVDLPAINCAFAPDGLGIIVAYISDRQADYLFDISIDGGNSWVTRVINATSPDNSNLSDITLVTSEFSSWFGTPVESPFDIDSAYQIHLLDSSGIIYHSPNSGKRWNNYHSPSGGTSETWPVMRMSINDEEYSNLILVQSAVSSLVYSYNDIRDGITLSAANGWNHTPIVWFGAGLFDMIDGALNYYNAIAFDAAISGFTVLVPTTLIGTYVEPNYPRISLDFGRTWNNVTGLPEGLNWVSACMSQNGTTMYIMTEDTVWKSSNSGASWVQSTGFTA